jgi:membrane protein required for colicin V production
MNGIDLLFILILLGGLALGFFQGTVKLLIAIVSFYVGIVLASLYFQAVGNFFRVQFRTSGEVGQITAFAIVLLVSFLLLTIAGLYTFRYLRVPKSLDFFDKILGTLLGLLMAALFMGMLAVLLRSLFIFRDAVRAGIDWPIMVAFQNGVRTSAMVSFFGNNILPLLYGFLRPILPDEADIIFRIQ